MNAVELAQKSGALFTLPDVYMKLQQLIRSPETGSNDIAELISTDAALTARLLKIANSSFYNFPAEIGTISRAINLIGTDQLMNLVLATSVAGSFSGVPADVIDMDSFWRHNVDTALIARSLAGASKQADIERLFVVGLLHNVGKLIALTEMPEQALQALTLEEGENPWQKQYDVLGFTFAECGAELLSVWELPTGLVEAVRFQHIPGLAGEDDVSSALLNIASRAASAMEQEICPDEGPDYLGWVDELSWDLTGLETTDMDVSVAYAQEEAWNMLGIISSTVY